MKPRIVFLAAGVLGTAAWWCSASHAVGKAPPRGEPVRVVAPDGPDRGAGQPQAAVDATGRIYVAFGRAGTVRCAVSAMEGDLPRTARPRTGRAARHRRGLP